METTTLLVGDLARAALAIHLEALLDQPDDARGVRGFVPVIRAFAVRCLNAATALDLVLGSPRYARLIDGLRELETCPWPESSRTPGALAYDDSTETETSVSGVATATVP